eukprot:2606048-Pyramimonas_sp.AAC.1
MLSISENVHVTMCQMNRPPSTLSTSARPQPSSPSAPRVPRREGAWNLRRRTSRLLPSLSPEPSC